MKKKKFQVTNNYKPVIFSDNEMLILFKTMDLHAKEFIDKKYYKLYYSYSIIFLD